MTVEFEAENGTSQLDGELARPRSTGISFAWIATLHGEARRPAQLDLAVDRGAARQVSVNVEGKDGSAREEDPSPDRSNVERIGEQSK